MKEHKTSTTASIREGYHCSECGWPIIDACCNDIFNNFKDAQNFDWWLYCSNKGCKNHDGKGVFQEWPDWVEKNKMCCDPCPLHCSDPDDCKFCEGRL